MNKLKHFIKNDKLSAIVFLIEAILVIILNIIILSLSSFDPLAIISVAASVFGILGTILGTAKLKQTFIFNVIYVILYGSFAYLSSWWGIFFLNICLYIPLNIYGYFSWSNKKIAKENKKLNSWWYLAIVGFVAIATIVWAAILKFNANSLTYLDMQVTLFSIVAMILSVFYFKQQWILWIVVNIFSLAIHILNLITYPDHVSSYIYLLVWLIFLFNSLLGVYRWYKTNKKRNSCLKQNI